MTENEINYAEAACCAWEFIQAATAEDPRSWGELFDEHGSAALRMACVHLAPHIHEGWELADTDIAPFDWEFVPWFMDTLVTISGDHLHKTGEFILHPDWRIVCAGFEETVKQRGVA